MGTWDIGFFDNDMACDWENSLENIKNLSLIEDTLTLVLNSHEDTLDIDIANKALAASEALARLINKDGDKNSYTKHLDEWVESFDQIIPIKIKELALYSIEKIINKNSELSQYWKLRGEYNNWLKNINDLKNRLR